MSRTVRATIAASISVAALWLAARNANFAGLRSSLANASFVWLLPYPFVCIVLNVIRGEIWRQLLRRRVGTASAFWAYSVGFLANNVLPFRLGEAARVVILAKRYDLPVVEVAAAAGLERLLDLAVLALMLALLGPFVARVPGLGSGAVAVALLVAGAVIAIAALAKVRRQLPDLMARATSRLSPDTSRGLVNRVRELSRGLTVLLDPSIGVPTAIAAASVWALTVLLQWFVLRAFQPQAGAADAAFMVAAVSLAIALPAAPGFVGVYHWAGQLSLVAVFPHLYDMDTALAAATVAHAASYLTSTALGVIGLWYFGMPPSAIAGALRERRGLEIPADDRDSLARVN